MTILTEELFRKIRRIQIETSVLAKDILAGAWHSAFKGKGMEFEEVREYMDGDEVRDIDWNVTARMNHPFVKQFREERELTVVLVVDVSASNRYGSREELKSERIAEIAAALAFTAIKNNDRIGLLLFTDEVEKYVPPAKGLGHVMRLIREVLAYEPRHKGTNLSAALHYLGKTQVKRSICFLITDYLTEASAKELGPIARKHDLISIVVTDPNELKFPQMGWITLRDLENNKTITFDSTDKELQQRFSDNAQKRLETHKKLMHKLGSGFIHLDVEQPYAPELRRYFKLRRIKH